MACVLLTKKLVCDIIDKHMDRDLRKSNPQDRRFNTKVTWANLPGLLGLPDTQLPALQKKVGGECCFGLKNVRLGVRSVRLGLTSRDWGFS